jgi:orotidine-5'-phosphate decarboxylase
MRERMFVALDTADETEALAVCDALDGLCTSVKVGMELYHSCGPRIVHILHERGLRIFLDLKLHDIPTTVYRTVRSLAALPIDLLNVHAFGGTDMMKAAVVAAAERSETVRILAVTILTSMSQNVLRYDIGIPDACDDVVVRLAARAQHSGVHGVVCAATDVPRIHAQCGYAFATLTPGIRTRTAPNDDQVRVATPAHAFALGAQWIVLGRAITNVPDPRKAWIEVCRLVEDNFRAPRA